MSSSTMTTRSRSLALASISTSTSCVPGNKKRSLDEISSGSSDSPSKRFKKCLKAEEAEEDAEEYFSVADEEEAEDKHIVGMPFKLKKYITSHLCFYDEKSREKLVVRKEIYITNEEKSMFTYKWELVSESEIYVKTHKDFDNDTKRLFFVEVMSVRVREFDPVE